MGCCDGYCGKCCSMQTLVLGALVVAQAYWGWFSSWGMFIGAMLVVYGAMRLIMPKCPCNKGGCCEGGVCAEEKPAKKKK